MHSMADLFCLKATFTVITVMNFNKKLAMYISSIFYQTIYLHLTIYLKDVASVFADEEIKSRRTSITSLGPLS